MSNITKSVLKRLFSLSGNICAFPNCNQHIYENEESSVLMAIAHIESKNLNGPRYNSHFSHQDSRSFENLMVLCPAHHKEIDDRPDNYSVQYLKTIKENHINNVRKRKFDYIKEILSNSLKILEISYSEILISLNSNHENFLNSISKSDHLKIQKSICVIEGNIFSEDRFDSLVIELMAEEKQIQKAFLTFGNFWNINKDFNKALDYYQALEENRALEENGDQFQLFYNLGSVLYFLNRIQKASKYLEKALEIDTDHISVNENLALLYSKLDRNIEAEGLYKKCLDKKYGDYKLLSNYGVFLTKTKKYQEAESILKSAYQLQSDNYKVSFNLGKLYDDWGKLKLASKFYWKSLDIEKTEKLVWFHYGLLMLKIYESRVDKKIFSNALKSLEEAYRLDPNDLDIKFDYARTLGKINDQNSLEKSLKLLKECNSDEKNDKALAFQIPILIALNRHKEVREISQSLSLQID